MRFVDTNILLYALSTREQEQEKRNAAIRILNDDDLALSVQVLQEFYAQATREQFPGRITHDEAVLYIESYKRFPVQELTVELLERAMATVGRYQIFNWDAAIIEAARALGCSVVLTEDLNHGQDFDGVRVVNPFRE